MYVARVTVTLRKSILDPQGKAILHALESLGLGSIKEARIGKLVEMQIACSSESEARQVTDEACKKLLANPVMEEYAFSLEKV